MAFSVATTEPMTGLSFGFVWVQSLDSCHHISLASFENPSGFSKTGATLRVATTLLESIILFLKQTLSNEINKIQYLSQTHAWEHQNYSKISFKQLIITLIIPVNITKKWIFYWVINNLRCHVIKISNWYVWPLNGLQQFSCPKVSQFWFHVLIQLLFVSIFVILYFLIYHDVGAIDVMVN